MRGSYGKNVTRWFSDYRKACGILNGEDKAFHSFRHTFINTLKQLGLEEKRIGTVVGHSDNSQTFGRYGKSYTPEFLKAEVIDKLRYGADLTRFVIAQDYPPLTHGAWGLSASHSYFKGEIATRIDPVAMAVAYWVDYLSNDTRKAEQEEKERMAEENLRRFMEHVVFPVAITGGVDNGGHQNCLGLSRG